MEGRVGEAAILSFLCFSLLCRDRDGLNRAGPQGASHAPMVVGVHGDRCVGHAYRIVSTKKQAGNYAGLFFT
ncbi:MAG: hypothetical protein V7606_4245 [Burkholderiales bacterium]